MDRYLSKYIMNIHNTNRNIHNRIVKISEVQYGGDEIDKMKFGKITTTAKEIKSVSRKILDINKTLITLDKSLSSLKAEIDITHDVSKTISNPLEALEKPIEDIINNYIEKVTSIYPNYSSGDEFIILPSNVALTDFQKEFAELFKYLLDDYDELVKKIETHDAEAENVNIYNELHDKIEESIQALEILNDSVKKFNGKLDTEIKKYEFNKDTFVEGDISKLKKDKASNKEKYKSKIAISSINATLMDPKKLNAFSAVVRNIISSLGVASEIIKDFNVDKINSEKINQLRDLEGTLHARHLGSGTAVQIAGEIKEEDMNSIGKQKLESKMIKLHGQLDQLSINISEVIEKSIVLNQIYIRHNYYVIYLVSILHFDKNKKEFSYFEYIDKEILEFYRTILENIVSKFRNLPFETHKENKAIRYFNTYHYILCHKMLNFIDFLLSVLTSDDVIDINKCSGQIFENFAIFNHFKDILDNYSKHYDIV